MIWKIKSKIEGDIKIKKRFCIFPRYDYNDGTGFTTWYWLEPVYVAYAWYDDWDGGGYWIKIGIATSYENAKNKIWE